MPRLWRSIRHQPQPVIAVLLVAITLVALAGPRQLGHLGGSLCVLGFCALVAVSRWRPVAVAVVAGFLVGLPEFTHNAQWVYDNSTYIPLWAAIFLYSYVLGADARFPLSLIGIAAVLVGVNLTGGGFNPVPEMMAFGPYAGGLAVASRRQASAQLELRARELEEEREIFAVQSVRYERARIARELHDIVAHCVSLMVVQANAGERLASFDPASAAEAFTSISEAANQAEGEINRLVELLHESAPSGPSAGLRIVEELVERAQASGLKISCQFSGDIDDLSERGADAAYRMVQEGITNAMKHAPGAAMRVSVNSDVDCVAIAVANGPPLAGPSGLERSGGGNGLAGMRERVRQCGGTFSAGANPEGGWKLEARLPHRAGARLAHSEGA